MHLLHFIDHAGEPVFSAMAEVVPRVGECVMHIIEPLNPNEWSPGTLHQQLAVSRRTFRVMRIDHEFRKSSVMRPEMQTIMLTVDAVDG